MGLFGITVEVTFPVTGASWYQELEEVAGHIAFPVKKGESCECLNSTQDFLFIQFMIPAQEGYQRYVFTSQLTLS